jgi:hypothetical protein
MPTLEDFQYSYGGRITVGADTAYEAVIVDGLEGFTARDGDKDLPRGHGDAKGKHYSAARQPMVVVELIGEDEDALQARIDEVLDAFVIEEDDLEEFTWRHPGQDERLIRVRPLSVVTNREAETGLVATVKIALKAPDPRIYSAAEHDLAVPLYTPSSGSIDYPVTNYPVNWPAGVAIEVVAHNAGNADAYPLVQFYGPSSGTCTGVLLRNQTTTEQLEVATDIASGQILAFDGTAYVTGSGDQVLGLDGSSRYGDWVQPRTPFRLVPGDNVLRFTIDGTATAMSCRLTYRDTSLS